MPFKDKAKRNEWTRKNQARPEVQAKRRVIAKRRAAERRFLETPDEREARLRKERVWNRSRKERMTDEQRAAAREYQTQYRKQWALNNRTKIQEYERAWSVGIHPDEIERMRRVQHNRCAICRREFNVTTDSRGRAVRNEHVDHCHVTGRVRGLLCRSCNHGIGRLGDNLDGVVRAVQYLSEPADPDCF